MKKLLLSVMMLAGIYSELKSAAGAGTHSQQTSLSGLNAQAAYTLPVELQGRSILKRKKPDPSLNQACDVYFSKIAQFPGRDQHSVFQRQQAAVEFDAAARSLAVKESVTHVLGVQARDVFESTEIDACDKTDKLSMVKKPSILRAAPKKQKKS